MKKIIATVLCFVLALSLFGCRTKDAQSIGTPAVPEDVVTMQGTILEIGNGEMIIEPVEGSDELTSADKYSVPMEHMDASPEPQAGYLVEITYDGSIEETYPAKLGTVYYIKIINDDADDKIKDIEVETSTNPGTYAVMPSVIGLSVCDAADLLENNGIINRQNPTFIFHDEDGQHINLSSKDYLVAKQNPKAGDRVILKENMINKQTEVLDFLCTK